MYDEALKPSGVKITQFGIMRLLAAMPGLTTGQIAEALAMDSTTLTRTLTIIRTSKWLEVKPGKDRRERHWSLTPAGQERVRAALPLWKNAQKQFAQMMHDVDLDSFNQTVFLVVQKANQQSIS